MFALSYFLNIVTILAKFIMMNVVGSCPKNFFLFRLYLMRLLTISISWIAPRRNEDKYTIGNSNLGIMNLVHRVYVVSLGI